MDTMPFDIGKVGKLYSKERVLSIWRKVHAHVLSLSSDIPTKKTPKFLVFAVLG